MELTIITKLLEVSITVCILIVVYFRNEKKADKREEDYKNFTNQVMSDSKEREMRMQEEIDDNRKIIKELTKNIDIINELKTEVKDIKDDVREIKRELK